MTGHRTGPNPRRPGLGLIGARLKQARVERGLTIQELSIVLNCSESSITAWENRGYYPKVPRLISLASTLDCSVDYLLCLEDEAGKKTKAWGVRDEAVRRFYEKLLREEITP
jgi:transcriptional regulator with XRE-family HTH domain